jgi:hypothetical protein
MMQEDKMMLSQLEVRRPYSMLTKVTLGGMTVVTLVYASEMLKLGLDREVSIAVGVLLLIDILVALRLRWAPALAALVLGFILYGNPFLMYNLSLPPTEHFFWAAWVQLIGSVIVIVAGIGATTENYRQKS